MRRTNLIKKAKTLSMEGKKGRRGWLGHLQPNTREPRRPRQPVVLTRVSKLAATGWYLKPYLDASTLDQKHNT